MAGLRRLQAGLVIGWAVAALATTGLVLGLAVATILAGSLAWAVAKSWAGSRLRLG